MISENFEYELKKQLLLQHMDLWGEIDALVVQKYGHDLLSKLINSIFKEINDVYEVMSEISDKLILNIMPDDFRPNLSLNPYESIEYKVKQQAYTDLRARLESILKDFDSFYRDKYKEMEKVYWEEKEKKDDK